MLRSFKFVDQSAQTDLSNEKWAVSSDYGVIGCLVSYLPNFGLIVFTREGNMRVATGKRASVVTEASIPKKRQRSEPARAVPDIEENPHFSLDEVADVSLRLAVSIGHTTGRCSAHFLRCQVQRMLLDWYDRNHRVLPWRRNFHSKLKNQASTVSQGAPLDMPQQQFMYHVWVCEVQAVPSCYVSFMSLNRSRE